MALITAATIKSTVDNRDLDTSLITTNLIEMAQEKHLRPILTKDLYDAVVASPSNYATLLTVITKPLAWFVYYELMLIYYVSVTEQGFMFNNSNNQTNVGTIEYNNLKNWAYQSAMVYYDDIIENLTDNAYSEYEDDKQMNKKIIGGIII